MQGTSTSPIIWANSCSSRYLAGPVHTFEDEIKLAFGLENISSFDLSAPRSLITPSNTPSLILLFTWTGAQRRHISKYVEGYATLFPYSPVLIIATTLKDLTVRSPAKKQQRLQKVIDVITNSRFARSSILVHCFSDGGANKAVEFAEAYYTRMGEKLPCQALCLDSTPGRPRYFNYVSAFKKSLPNNLMVQWFGLLLGLITLAIIWVLYYCLLGFKNNVITKTRQRLEDERYWNPKSTPRVYLFSYTDNLISWKDIEQHAIDAAQNGVRTTLVRFKGSKHCNHVAENETKYWRSIREVWEMRDLELGLFSH